MTLQYLNTGFENTSPLGADWRLFGRQMREAFREYFG